MKCARNDTPLKHLRKTARLAIAEGKTKEEFVGQFIPVYQALAGRAFDVVKPQTKVS